MIRALVARGDGNADRRRRPVTRQAPPSVDAGAMGGRSPAADAAGRGRPRGRRRGPRLLRRARSARRRRCWPWWSASPYRSGSTTPTTTPTASAAPTRSGSGRCDWSAPVWPLRPRSSAAALASFAVAGLAGLGLVILTGQWWLLAVGVACVLAAWFYTGGRHPYGYRGLGEVFVFVFFGLVAVGGTTYVQVGRVRLGHAADRSGDRCAGLRDPGGQQPARHRRGHPRRQAHAGHPARPAGHPAPLRRPGRVGRGGHRRGRRARPRPGRCWGSAVCSCWSRPCGRCCPAGRARRWSGC